jgi:hypothetical protein
MHSIEYVTLKGAYNDFIDCKVFWHVYISRFQIDMVWNWSYFEQRVMIWLFPAINWRNFDPLFYTLMIKKSYSFSM